MRKNFNAMSNWCSIQRPVFSYFSYRHQSNAEHRAIDKVSRWSHRNFSLNDFITVKGRCLEVVVREQNIFCCTTARMTECKGRSSPKMKRRIDAKKVALTVASVAWQEFPEELMLEGSSSRIQVGYSSLSVLGSSASVVQLLHERQTSGDFSPDPLPVLFCCQWPPHWHQ